MALMKAALAPVEYRAEANRKPSRIGWAAAVLFLGVAWVAAIRHLQLEWSHNPQYAYAWSVPFLSVYLLWRRWLDRPAPQPHSTVGPCVVLVGGAFLLVALRFIAEANPDWRLLSWTLSSVAVAVSLALILYVGGWPWLRHFAFPILFMVVAVPWPVQFEQVVIQGLMRAVTGINVFLLTVAGVPALQHGNVIEVRSGLIGIEEACSGVRSLQATLMVSLFLGEFYYFSVMRRLILIVAGTALAFFCNLVRTAILVWLGANKGAESIEAWHDPAGLTILLVCLFGLWGVSLLMGRGQTEFSAGNAGSVQSPRSVPVALFAGLVCFLLLAEVGIQTWYRWHQSTIASSRWHARWPESEQSFKSIPIPPATQGILRYDDGGGATWNGTDVHHWVMYFFRWLPGRTAALFVKIH